MGNVQCNLSLCIIVLLLCTCMCNTVGTKITSSWSRKEMDRYGTEEEICRRSTRDDVYSNSGNNSIPVEQCRSRKAGLFN